jgi:5'(3')-deoxyribonucleotidase
MKRKHWKDSPSTRMRVKVDIDGVLRDTFSAMVNLYNREFDEKLQVSDIISYDSDISFPLIHERLGKPGNTWFFKEHPRECFLAPAFPGVSEALKELRDNGWDIIICTNQPTEAGRRYTLQFLEDNKIPYDELHFTKSKHLVSGDYLIDDAPEFLMAPTRDLESRICIDYPFNRGIPSDFRAKSLVEATKLLKESSCQILINDEHEK